MATSRQPGPGLKLKSLKLKSLEPDAYSHAFEALSCASHYCLFDLRRVRSRSTAIMVATQIVAVRYPPKTSVG